LRDELAHVNAYLTIEKARFADRLAIEISISDSLLDIKVPSFTLQPLVENAIKHGISNRLEGGVVKIYSQQTYSGVQIIVEDNAGAFQIDKLDKKGLGLQIVSKRLEHHFRGDSALVSDSKENIYTKMSFIIPNEFCQP
jgi:two-component system LytT family sensor kinase